MLIFTIFHSASLIESLRVWFMTNIASSNFLLLINLCHGLDIIFILLRNIVTNFEHPLNCVSWWAVINYHNRRILWFYLSRMPRVDFSWSDCFYFMGWLLIFQKFDFLNLWVFLLINIKIWPRWLSHLLLNSKLLLCVVPLFHFNNILSQIIVNYNLGVARFYVRITLVLYLLWYLPIRRILLLILINKLIFCLLFNE